MSAGQVVLGIDAAWTDRNPSGVAAVAIEAAGPRLLAAAPSYAAFVGSDPADFRPDPAALIEACVRIAGAVPDLIAIDMPIATQPITGRRHCDNAVSAAYGARKAGTHSPSRARPGALSDALRAGFAAGGYRVLTGGMTGRGLAEVYPHAALIELTGARERLPYKMVKTRSYWPGLDAAERAGRLRRVWADIVAALDRVVADTAAMLPLPPPEAVGAALKAFEDKLDAVICAWVGCCMLDGRARAYGDADAAIWVPLPPAR